MSWNEQRVRGEFKVHTHCGSKTVTIENINNLAVVRSNERSYAREQDAGVIGGSMRKVDKTIL